MSEKNFLERWSRLKRDAAQQREKESPSQDATERAPEHKQDSDPAVPAAGQLAFDPASLPPVESINAISDVRAFLTPGVPAALTRAALRRAWVADPAIRDFVGLSENAWDFTDPGSIPGFGDIGGSENLRRLVAHLTDGTGTVSEDRPPEPDREASEAAQLEQDSVETPERVAAVNEPKLDEEPAAAEDQPALLQHNKDDDAVHNESAPAEYPPTAPRRGHGRALPE